MSKRADKNLIIGLDVGTSKVAALVGEISPNNEIEIIGVGLQPSRGLKKGVVVNIESTVQSIQRAIEEAELMAGCEIRSVFAGIAGSHVRSLNSHGVVAIRDREVSHADVEHVVDAATFPADGQEISGKAVGTVELNGVPKKDVPFTYKAKRTGNSYAVTGSVKMNVTQHGIKEDDLCEMKICAKPEVLVDVKFSVSE